MYDWIKNGLFKLNAQGLARKMPTKILSFSKTPREVEEGNECVNAS